MFKFSCMSYARLSTDFAFHELGSYSLLLKFVLGRTIKPLSLGTKPTNSQHTRAATPLVRTERNSKVRNSEIVTVTNPTQFVDLGFRRMIFLLKSIFLNAR